MPKCSGRTANPGGPALPVFITQTSIFPSTFLDVTGFVKVFRLPEPTDYTEYFVLKNDVGDERDLINLRSIGVVCILEKRDNKYFLSGKFRAEAIKIWREKGKLVAQTEELKDIPPIEELTGIEMPMLWGCIDSICLSLKKWQQKIPKEDEELHKKIGAQISKIDSRRREKEMVYSLPWHMLVNFPNFFSQEFKEEMLKTNKVIDRLMSIVEILQQEIRASQYAASFTEIEAEDQIKSETETGTG